MPHAFVHFTESAITLKEWEAFCAEHELALSDAVGGNVYTRGGRNGIEAVFGQGTRRETAPPPPEWAEDVVFSTLWGGSKLAELAQLAGAFWARFGGAMFADETVRRTIVGNAL